MSKSLEVLALRKQVLQARSTFYRLRIRHEVNEIRDGRLARTIALAVRFLPLAPLAGIAINLLRKRSPWK